MNKTTKILILLGLGGIAVFFLVWKSSAQTSGSGGPSGVRKAAAFVAGLIPTAIKVIKGLGGAAATGGATAAVTGGTTAAATASTSAGIAGGSTTAGVGAGAGAFSLAGLFAAGAFLLINLKLAFGMGTEPAWHKEWRENGGLEAWAKGMNQAPANLSFSDIGPKEYAGIKANEPKYDPDEGVGIPPAGGWEIR